MHTFLNATLRTARRIAIGIIGGTVALVGVIMLVTPGPGLLVIPAGLAILALEFEFARRWLKSLKKRTASTAALLKHPHTHNPTNTAAKDHQKQ